MAIKVQIRRGTKAQLTTYGALSAGELGYTTDEKLVYVGDGSTAANFLVGRCASGSGAPSGNLIAGTVYFDTTADRFYFCNGSSWEAAAGLALQLEYVNSTTISLKAINSDVDIIFPNLESVTITTAGITKTVSGNTGTLYYVYLTTAGDLSISTNAPSDVYSNIEFYGETNVLVGYLGCSAINAIAGTHNVYSYWNEPQRTYTQSTTTLPSSALSLTGFVAKTGKTSTATWSGSISGTTVANWYSDLGETCWGYHATATAVSTGVGTVSANGSPSIQIGGMGCDWNAILTRSQTISLSASSVSAGLSNVSITISGSQSYSDNTANTINVISNAFTSISGTITLTRPGS